MLRPFKKYIIKEQSQYFQSGAGNKLLLVPGGDGGDGGPYLCAPSLPSRSDLQESTEELTHVGMTILGSMDAGGGGSDGCCCCCCVELSS